MTKIGLLIIISPVMPHVNIKTEASELPTFVTAQQNLSVTTLVLRVDITTQLVTNKGNVYSTDSHLTV